MAGNNAANPSSTNSDTTSVDGSINTDGVGSPAGGPAAGIAVDNPVASRLAGSGLTTGAQPPNSQFSGQVFNLNFKSANGNPIDTVDDWRVRISMQPGTSDLFYSANNLVTRPLVATRGVIFPYTPAMTINHVARYGSTPLTHANYSSYFYEGSEVQNITITGEFTVQDVNEGQYLMAVVQFFRACTKMFYGNEPLAGTPPPMVFLDGYGAAYLPHVPCVVTQFSHTMPNDVDYVEVPVGLPTLNGSLIDTSNFAVRTRLPTTSTISLQLQPIYSRSNIAANFTLEKFAQGQLINGSTSPRGGFI